MKIKKKKVKSKYTETEPGSSEASWSRPWSVARGAGACRQASLEVAVLTETVLRLSGLQPWFLHHASLRALHLPLPVLLLVCYHNPRTSWHKHLGKRPGPWAGTWGAGRPALTPPFCFVFQGRARERKTEISKSSHLLCSLSQMLPTDRDRPD